MRKGRRLEEGRAKGEKRKGTPEWNKEGVWEEGGCRVRRVKRTRGANGRCGATKTPSPTPQNHKGRVAMPHISEPKRRRAKLQICEARKGD